MSKRRGEYVLKTHWPSPNGFLTICGKHDMPPEAMRDIGTEISCKVCSRSKSGQFVAAIERVVRELEHEYDQ